MDYTGNAVDVYTAKGASKITGVALGMNPIGIMVLVSDDDHVLVPWGNVSEAHFAPHK